MSPAAQSVIDRLDAARQRWWLFTSLSTAVLALATSFGLLVAFMLSDALLHFSQIALGLLLAVWLMASGRYWYGWLAGGWPATSGPSRPRRVGSRPSCRSWAAT